MREISDDDNWRQPEDWWSRPRRSVSPWLLAIFVVIVFAILAVLVGPLEFD